MIWVKLRSWHVAAYPTPHGWQLLCGREASGNAPTKPELPGWMKSCEGCFRTIAWRTMRMRPLSDAYIQAASEEAG